MEWEINEKLKVETVFDIDLDIQYSIHIRTGSLFIIL